MIKIKWILFFFVFQSFSAHAWTKKNELDGLGVEILTGGVGQARLGSSGAVASNPALLGWISKKQQFISTNQINFYGLKTEDGTSVDVNPDVTPLYAVTTEGFGHWGHGYGLTASDVKLAYFTAEGSKINSGVQENQELGLNYAFGYRLSQNFALGLGVYASRIQEELNSSILNEEAGKRYVFSINEKSSVWVQGFSLGLAGQFEGWDFGLSTKFSTITYMPSRDSIQTAYIEEANAVYRIKNQDIPPLDMLPSFSGGVRTKVKNVHVLFDVNWLPGGHNSEMEEDFGSQMMFALGGEGYLSERYKWYGGIRHQTPGQGDSGSNTVSIGASKKNSHSLNFAGLAWLREGRKHGSQVVMINFGTMFDY